MNEIPDIYTGFNTLIDKYPHLAHEVALEADSGKLDEEFISRYSNVEKTSMMLDLITDKDIEDAGIERVTSPIIYEKDGIPHPEGLLSEFIFGTTQRERSKTIAYIDLGGKFFNPYFYECLCRVRRDFGKVAAGTGEWDIKNGELIKIADTVNDPFAEPRSGMKWLIENFHKLKFEKGKSLAQNEKIQFINGCIKNGSCFISKWVVIPIIYRDSQSQSATMKTVDEINTMYSKLIGYANAIESSSLQSVNNLNMYRVQTQLVAIRKYGQSLVEKKNGFFKRGVMGKNQDFGGRSVISTPLLSGVKNPSQCAIDCIHTGVPLSQCISMAYPIVKYGLSEFFARLFESSGNKIVALSYIDQKDPKKGYESRLIEVDNAIEKFSDEYLHKMANIYINSYRNRFDKIEVPVKNSNGKKYYLSFCYKTNEGQKIVRPLTWTDVLFQVCYNQLKDKHIYVTRYPMVDYLSIFVNKIRVLSTVKTIPQITVWNLMKDGPTDEVFQFYPAVDFTADEEKINTLFIDTLTMSNLYLNTLGGDYDGDTVSFRMVFSEEANQEAHELVNSPKNYFNLKGDLVRIIKNEAFLTFYNMTSY